jgi:transcription elongation factor Elf1
MKGSIPFLTTCPVCGHPRLQSGYTRRVLRGLIDTNQAIEAYCQACDVYWAIREQERFILSRTVTEHTHDTLLLDEYVSRRGPAR